MNEHQDFCVCRLQRLNHDEEKLARSSLIINFQKEANPNNLGRSPVRSLKLDPQCRDKSYRAWDLEPLPQTSQHSWQPEHLQVHLQIQESSVNLQAHPQISWLQ
uniref:Haloacid dehalogenase-like hydrolase n=1 Tax=Rhizophora mucronata TaxID=61149 RepID=A0A2P2JVI7_RHIMU